MLLQPAVGKSHPFASFERLFDFPPFARRRRVWWLREMVFSGLNLVFALHLLAHGMKAHSFLSRSKVFVPFVKIQRRENGSFIAALPFLELDQREEEENADVAGVIVTPFQVPLSSTPIAGKGGTNQRLNTKDMIGQA
ncbi:hypothetical protein B0H14DRAFT_2565429 [Mycena olivaceomarginata]|nr:hypothetical protein B0H14DRAFT_2565429 [Mycena olivaceomarginata]